MTRVLLLTCLLSLASVQLVAGKAEPTTTPTPNPPEFNYLLTFTEELLNGTGIDPARLKKVMVYPNIHETKYPDGKTCDKGQTPWTYKEMGLLLRQANKKDPRVKATEHQALRLNLTHGTQKALNEYATRKYGKNCKHEKCYYDQKYGSYICGSGVLGPGPTLLLVALCRLWADIFKGNS